MKKLAAVAFASLLVLASAPADALTFPVQSSPFKDVASENVQQVVVVRRGGYVARGPRGGVVAGRTTVVRPGYPGRWERPSWYRWGPGGAIAAGAALGLSPPVRPSPMPASRRRRAIAGIIPT